MCRLLQITIRLGLTALLMYSLAGCKTSSTAVNPPTAPAAVAPGYTSPADQKMGEILESARNFFLTLQQEKAAGTFVPSATEQAALNAFAATLNTALSQYTAFHQGTATQAQAQAAVDSLKTAQQQLTNQLQPTLNPNSSQL